MSFECLWSKLARSLHTTLRPLSLQPGWATRPALSQTNHSGCFSSRSASTEQWLMTRSVIIRRPDFLRGPDRISDLLFGRPPAPGIHQERVEAKIVRDRVEAAGSARKLNRVHEDPVEPHGRGPVEVCLPGREGPCQQGKEVVYDHLLSLFVVLNLPRYTIDFCLSEEDPGICFSPLDARSMDLDFSRLVSGLRPLGSLTNRRGGAKQNRVTF